MTNDEIHGRALSIARNRMIRDSLIDLTQEIERSIREAVTAALEEAAKVADQHGDDAKAHPMYPAYGMNSRVVAAGSIACAIRALKPTASTGTKE